MISRAYRALTLSLRHKYGSSPLAGKRRVGHTTKPGLGISRMPRLAGGSKVVGISSAVGGKSAHSPRSTKNMYVKINENERKIARFSAIALTASVKAVQERGHKINSDITLPIVVNDEIGQIKKTKDAVSLMKALGVYDDILRAKEGKHIRAGRGKMRGRRYEHAKGPLIVVSTHDAPIVRAAKNILGVDVINAKEVSVIHLAPGGHPGRLTIFTLPALKVLQDRLGGRLL